MRRLGLTHAHARRRRRRRARPAWRRAAAARDSLVPTCQLAAGVPLLARADAGAAHQVQHRFALTAPLRLMRVAVEQPDRLRRCRGLDRGFACARTRSRSAASSRSTAAKPARMLRAAFIALSLCREMDHRAAATNKAADQWQNRPIDARAGNPAWGVQGPDDEAAVSPSNPG
jgi:hypothetical protein